MTVADLNDGTKITLKEVLDFIKAAKPDTSSEEILQIYQPVLEELISKHVLEKETEKSDIPNSEEAKKNREEVKNDVLSREFVSQNVKTDEKKIHQKYDEFKNIFNKQKRKQIEVRHILVDTKEKAEELITKINGQKKKFDEHVKNDSVDEKTKENSGKLPPIILDEKLPDEIKKTLANAVSGTILKKPLELFKGKWSVIFINKVGHEALPSMDELRQELNQIVYAENLKEFLDKLSKEEGVVITNEKDSADPSTDSTQKEEKDDATSE
jgi:peptidyl-prolyl cis-trans isomerase C